MIGNDRIVAVPTIDLILNETFEYKRLPHYSGYASRGIFTVKMEHTLLPLFASSRLKPTAPFETPVMAGSVFAINAHFFWELQLYSDGLQPHGVFKTILMQANFLFVSFGKCRWRAI